MYSQKFKEDFLKMLKNENLWEKGNEYMDDICMYGYLYSWEAVID